MSTERTLSLSPIKFYHKLCTSLFYSLQSFLLGLLRKHGLGVKRLKHQLQEHGDQVM